MQIRRKGVFILSLKNVSLFFIDFVDWIRYILGEEYFLSILVLHPVNSLVYVIYTLCALFGIINKR